MSWRNAWRCGTARCWSSDFPGSAAATNTTINYRHVIDWLVRKPGAFAGYRYQDAMFPTSRFRRVYDALLEQSPSRAAKDYLRILELAAKESEAGVDAVLGRLLEWNVPITPTVVAEHLAHDLGLPRAMEVVDHNGGFVDLRRVTRNQGGHPISRPTDLHESLTDCLRELHLPTIRDEYESAAQRARQESLELRALLAGSGRARVRIPALEPGRAAVARIEVVHGEEPVDPGPEAAAAEGGAAGPVPAGRRLRRST